MTAAWEFLLKGAARRLCGVGDRVNTGNLAIECLRRLDELAPEHRALWRRSCATMMRASVAATDPATGTVEVRGYGRYNVGLRAACSAAVADEWLGRRRYADFAWHVLQLYNRRAMFYHHDQTHQPRRHNRVNWWFDAVSGHHYASWLLAYWRLRNLALAGRAPEFPVSAQDLTDVLAEDQRN